MHNAKRPIALLLVLCMLLSVLPVSALAISISDKPANGTTKSQPFAAGTAESTNFRIPGLITLDNGRVIATIDARWSWAADAGGIDTLVSVSDDNGANWTYTFANYLGDNGNVANNTSCCFIDPAIATDGTTAYMIADLYPAGFAINSARYYAQAGSTGFDANGNLMLRSDSENGLTFGDNGYETGAKNATYGYYLDGGKIYTTAGAEVEGYTVDAYFNITGNGINTNLFFSDSPYKPFPTDFLYMTTSTDGLNWSEPELLNVKAPEEQSYLVGPGNGTYHEANDHMIFTAYRHTGGASGTAYECTSLIWMDENGNWYRSEDATRNSWSSEATAVVLDDGTVRVFYRDGYTALRYTDYVYDETVNNYVVTACEVSTEATVDSGCQLTAIKYSGQIDGKDVILVASPTSSRRINGYIYAFLVDENNDMELAYAFNVTPDAYAYSCLTELADGSIALLYENAGASVYYEVYDFEEIANRANDPRLTVKEVELLEGYNKVFTDGTGYYVNADISELNTEVATLTMTGQQITTNAAQVLGNSANIDLDSCQYTFTAIEDGYYNVSAVTADGATVYLNHFSTTNSNIPNITTTPGKIAVQASSYENMFKLVAQNIDGSNNPARSLHFHMEASTPYWNRCGNDTTMKCHEYLYRKAVAGETSSAEIPGYVLITGLDQIVDGGKYLIAAKNDAGNWYVLNPSTSTEKLNHVARIMGSTTVSSTELTFTGVGEGYTEVVVGSTLYQVTVHDVAEVNVDLTVGATATFTEPNGNYADADTSALDTSVATVALSGVDGTADNGLSLVPVTELTEGKYVIVNTRANKLVTNAPASAAAAAGAGSGLNMSGTIRDEVADIAIWTIAAADGGYTVQDQAGQYMTIGSKTAGLTASSSILTMNYNGSTWTIAQNGAYLNHFGGGSSTCAAGWQDSTAAGDAGSQFAIYAYSEEPVGASTELTFTGVAQGNTEVLIGHTLYLITVTEGSEPIDPEPTEPTEPEPTEPEPTVPVMPPEQEADDDSRDIPVSVLTATAGDWQTGYEATEGPAELVLDGDYNTLWHTNWQGTSRANHWIQFELSESYLVDGLRYKPRGGSSTNGNITEYDIQVSNDGVTFRSVTTGNWSGDSSWKIAQFAREDVKYVRLVAVNALTDNSWVFASAAEIRLTGDPAEVGDVDKAALNTLIAECELIEQGNYTAKSWQDFQKALEAARKVAANDYASQTKVDEACNALLQARENLKEKVEGEGVQKIFHLDSGRKFFSKDWTIALLNELSAAGYTHLQLAFGNNGFRFLLDDMTIDCDGTIYDSDDVKAGIKLGNANYYDEGEKHALTESEMDEIIAHANSVGIQIIPHLNMPGHMSALLDAMDYVGVAYPHFTGYVASDSSVDLNNQAALDFMLVLVDKYAAYFADAGCKYFHIGADEYANDAYNGNMGFPNMGATLYQKFADFVNDTAAIVKSYGMTPRAWNDGIYYGSYTAEFDTDIEITYWSPGWWGYDLAKTPKFVEKGHGLINTNGSYYYILGVNDAFTEDSSTTHTPGVYLPAESFDVTRFADSSTVEEPIGGMFCVWADYPGTETETEVAANIRLLLRAMALRMEGLDLDGMNTGIVEGGFNEDGTINSTGELPHEHEWSDWTVTTEPTCTEKGVETRTCECGETETREVAALGHTEAEAVIENNVDPTCTEAGSYDSVVYCSECGEEISRETITVDALGHDFVDGVCSRCGEVEPSEPVVNPFVDVPEGIYFYEPVLWAVEQNITKGTDETHFSPDKSVSRAEVVTFLWRAAGKPEPTTTENPFEDVAEGVFYYDAVLWAVEEGITKGTDPKHFAPDLECNRAQVVTFLWRANNKPAPTATENPFNDVVEGEFYYDAVLWAVEEGITKGVTSSAFGVAGTCNRAQIVTFLYRVATK